MPHNRAVPDDRLPTLPRVLASIVTMAAIMALIALVGERLLIPSTAVRKVDAVGMDLGAQLLRDRPRLVDLARIWSTLSGPWFVHPVVLLVGISFSTTALVLRLATDWEARYAVVTALAVTMLVIQIVARGMTSPLREMTAAAQAMARGEFQVNPEAIADGLIASVQELVGR